MLVIDALMDRITKNNDTCTKNRTIKYLKYDDGLAYDLEIGEEENGYCVNDESERNARLEENKMMLEFLHDAYAPLNDWIQWFLISQKGPSESTEEIETGVVWNNVI